MDVKDEKIPLLCHACLCVDKYVNIITDEKLQKYYLDALAEIPLNNTKIVNITLCFECKAFLQKSCTFKEQVKDSYRILQTYTYEDLDAYLFTDVSRPHLLSIHKTEPVNIVPSDCEVSHQTVLVNVKDEYSGHLEFSKEDSDEHIKDSWLSDTIDNADTIDQEEEWGIEKPQTIICSVDKSSKKSKRDVKSKVKKSNKIVKRFKGKKPKRQKQDGKVVSIFLTYEEMMQEREMESKRDAYMRSEYRCDTCLVGFMYKKAYDTHYNNKHSANLGEYICPICKTIFASVDAFTAHYKRHMRRYECIMCQKRTADLKVMQQHYYSAHKISLKEYKCNICGKISSSIDTHRYHQDTHKSRVQCAHCDKTFRHRAGLQNHRLTVHELRTEYPCTVCDKVFKWKNSLKRHLEKHETKPVTSTAYCSTCNISFACSASYQRHLKNSLKHVTQDQLKFICDHCNRRFSDKTKLRDHIEEKHLFKTFTCHICSKTSKNRVGLDQHIRNVHRGRPKNNMCHHCGKGFPTRIQLDCHIRTHTGERPFICEFCPATFRQQSNLYKHNRQIHLNIKSKRYSSNKKNKDVPEQIVKLPTDDQQNVTDDTYLPSYSAVIYA